MSLPFVSCLCCTYGRPILLGEAVKCFLDQDYPNKELIIINDQLEKAAKELESIIISTRCRPESCKKEIGFILRSFSEDE